LAGGHSRSDEHPNHEDHPGQLQTEHNGDHDQCREQNIQEAHRVAVGRSKLIIKRDEFELFPEECQHAKRDESDQGDQLDILAHNGRSLPKDKLI
jgi:hypothetical protein